MPALLSSKKSPASTILSNNATRPPGPLAHRELSATYVTPMQELPRQSQVSTVDLSDGNGHSVNISAKRLPSSPHKPKSPAKRRNVDEINDSDTYDDDDNNYMDILDEIKPESPVAKRLDTTPLTKSRFFEAMELTPHRIPDSTLLSDNKGAPARDRSPSPLSVKALSQNLPKPKESARPVRKSFSPVAVIDTSNPPPYDMTPKSLKLKSPHQSNTFKASVLSNLRRDLQDLKADMLDIVLDPGRGANSAEGQANTQKRAQIEEQILHLSSENRAELEQRLASMNSEVVTEYVLTGQPVPIKLRDSIRELQDQIKQMASEKLSTSSPSITPAAGGQPRMHQTAYTISREPIVSVANVNERGVSIHPGVESHSTASLQSAKLETDVIELSDDEDFQHNMDPGVDFDEHDFSDGLDYAAEELEAQRQRYEELSQAARVRSTQQNELSGRTKPRSVPLPRIAEAQRITATPTQSSAAKRRTKHKPATQEPIPVDLMSLPGMQHSWSRDVAQVLKETFKLHAFRSNQLEAINATLSGQDVFVLMPTGGGKSLCYQLPSVVRSGRTRGLTVVVSPLVSLMQDQVEHLEAVGIRASAYNGEKTQTEKNKIRNQVIQGDMDCLYVTPELLALSDHIVEVFQQLQRKDMLARIVIDEAHCVSQWGHDFRPDYKKLGDFRSKFDGIPVIALTATANDKVQVDVKDHLRLKNPACFRQSFNRPNLHYHVFPRSSGSVDKINQLIRDEHAGEAGIIYCMSKRDCERMASAVPNSAFYHAGMEKKERARVQRSWQLGEVRIICATIAFGMGIDKADVRFVIHNSLPKSLEGYYQETGRAGRDGEVAMCYLFWAFKDKQLLDRMIDQPQEGVYVSREQKKNMKDGIQRVVDYADNKADCRRSQVLGFFNEQFDPASCQETCDNCQSDQIYSEQDVTDAAKAAVRIVRAVQDCSDNARDSRATLGDCVNIARGSLNSRITERGWNQVDGFGLLKSSAQWDTTNTTKLFQHLISTAVLAEKHVTNPRGFVNTYCVPGTRANSVLIGRLPVNMRLQTPRAAKKSSKPRTIRGEPRSCDILEEDDISNFLMDDALPPPAFTLAQDPQRTTRPAAPKPRKIGNDQERLEAQYKIKLAPLDIDRINRCKDALISLRDDIQKTKGHRRIETSFDNQVIQDLAVKLPTSILDLRKIDGLRTESIDEHGFRILQVIEPFHHEYKRDQAYKESDPSKLNTAAGKATFTIASGRSGPNTVAGKARINYFEPHFRQEAEDDELDFQPSPSSNTTKKKIPKNKTRRSSQSKTRKARPKPSIGIAKPRVG